MNNRQIGTLYMVIILSIILMMTSTVDAQELPSTADFYLPPPVWSHDGQSIAVMNGNTVEIWAAAPSQLRLTLTGHTDRVDAVAWSPDDNMIATGGDDGIIKIWESTTGTMVRELPQIEDRVIGLKWSPQGNRLVSGHIRYTNGFMYLWDTITWQRIAELDHNMGGSETIAYSPDGRYLARVGGSYTLIDAQTLNVIAMRNLPEEECCGSVSIVSAVWSPDGQTVAIGTLNGLVHIWNAQILEVQHTFLVASRSAPQSVPYADLPDVWLRAMAFSPDSQFLVAIAGDGLTSRWDVHTGARIESVQTTSLIAAAWSSRSGQLASIPAIFSSENLGVQSTGRLTISVPFTSTATLNSLAAGCQPTSGETLISMQSSSDTSTETFITTLTNMPETALPPGCRADLLAVAAAMDAQGD
ncbi:MAG: hypothetical protein SF123_25765 [Chloroflexota bacterium]|nr:hypothetical protein [Chloroflexota bacterium]